MSDQPASDEGPADEDTAGEPFDVPPVPGPPPGDEDVENDREPPVNPAVMSPE